MTHVQKNSFGHNNCNDRMQVAALKIVFMRKAESVELLKLPCGYSI